MLDVKVVKMKVPTAEGTLEPDVRLNISTFCRLHEEHDRLDSVYSDGELDLRQDAD